MGRVITQTIRQRLADPDQFFANGTFAAGSIPLIGGTVDLKSDGFLPVRVGFTTGLTGSTANATVTGKDFFGNALAETVVLPGASSTVSTVNQFSFISDISIDGAATNLSAGVLAADEQGGPWTPWNPHQGDSQKVIEVSLVSGTLGASSGVQHCLQKELLREGPASVQTPFAAEAPLNAITTDTVDVFNGPFTASRFVIAGDSTTAVVRVKYLQAGVTG